MRLVRAKVMRFCAKVSSPHNGMDCRKLERTQQEIHCYIRVSVSISGTTERISVKIGIGFYTKYY